ncbi:MAG: FecR family protein [Deltaproteobacteria bacterium]
MKDSDKILLFHKILTGQVSDEENDFFLSYIRDKSNHREFYEYKTIWESSHVIDKPSTQLSKSEIRQEIFRQIGTNSKTGKVTGQRVFRLSYYAKIAAVAAMLLLILAVGSLIYRTITTTSIDSSESMVYEILPDGSKVWLSGHSSIAFKNKFSGSAREIKLKGSAYFNVTHNVKHPFIVYFNDNTVKVIGTSFQIIQYENDNFELSVFSGKVAFDNKDIDPIVLKKGESYHFNGNTGEIRTIEKLNSDLRSGYLTFENADLYDVFYKLSQFFDCKIHINCDDVTKMRGYTSPGYAGEDIQKYFSTIEKLYKIQIVKIKENSFRVNCSE